MRHVILVCITLLAVLSLNAQNAEGYLPKKKQKYREDQFYLGAVYNVIINLPKGFNQNNFSYGLHAGFIRDFPLNENCDRAVGIGLGYATNSYYSNILIDQKGSDILYSSEGDSGSRFTKNKIETHLLEIPLEFRIRTSTYESSIFWRWYFGFKVSYVFDNRSLSVFSTGERITFYNPHINRFRYSVYLAFNFKGNWNIFVNYDINNIFNPSKVFLDKDNTPVNIKGLRLGMRFYIL